MKDTNIPIDVGSPPICDVSQQLLSQLNSLKTKTQSISSEICSNFRDSVLSDVTGEAVKNCSKITKAQLFASIKSLIAHCDIVCSNLDLVSKLCNPNETKIDSTESSIKEKLDHLGTVQDEKFVKVTDQIARLQDTVNILTGKTESNDCSTSDFKSDYENNNPKDFSENSRLNIRNPTKCIKNYSSDFIPDDQSKELLDYLNNCNGFENNVENGHSVMNYGYPYRYTGSKHSNYKVNDIPAPIQKVIDSIHEKHPDSIINSCLVNKYCGTASSLPPHSDDEFSISPGSSIFTVSVGFQTDVKFTEIHNPTNVVVETIAANSLYEMSHESQYYWKHEIEKSNTLTSSDIRYSLTFRYVSRKFLKSSIIVGDSNTQGLKFGEGKGTFGHLMPGTKVQAFVIDDVNPHDCVGYKNIFIHCGVNDIKNGDINGVQKVEQCFNKLAEKINVIKTLCPKSKLHISPMLPTKDAQLNAKCIYFNKLLFALVNRSVGRVLADNFGIFCDSSGYLSEQMGRYKRPYDKLHLGSTGIYQLAQIIRKCVHGHLNTNKQPYSSILKGGSGMSSSESAHGVVSHVHNRVTTP